MTLLRTIKNTIARHRTPDAPADAAAVKKNLADYSEADGEALLEAYQRAKRHGEIYEYPDGDGSVVKITDEVLEE